jgi:hypothetical protein
VSRHADGKGLPFTAASVGCSSRALRSRHVSLLELLRVPQPVVQWAFDPVTAAVFRRTQPARAQRLARIYMADGSR